MTNYKIDYELNDLYKKMLRYLLNTKIKELNMLVISKKTLKKNKKDFLKEFHNLNKNSLSDRKYYNTKTKKFELMTNEQYGINELSHYDSAFATIRRQLKELNVQINSLYNFLNNKKVIYGNKIESKIMELIC